MMGKKFVEYRGATVIEGHPEKIAAAQVERTYIINGAAFPRIAYGNEKEDWGANERHCHDCAAVKGEFHVPGCDVERCPACGAQLIGCGCAAKLA